MPDANNGLATRQSPFRAQSASMEPQRTKDSNRPPAIAPEERLRVLHVGCGSSDAKRLHPVFTPSRWDEIRLDIDKKTNPDIAGSIVDMKAFAEDESCDAIWASHVLEHLLQHEVGKALSEFRRILVPSGFTLIRTPDLESVAQFILDGRVQDVIYRSAAGPITPLDMIYGHGASIERGSHAMRHGTAFTQDSMAQHLLDAGFSELRVTRTETLEVWAIGFMPEADIESILSDLSKGGIDLRSES